MLAACLGDKLVFQQSHQSCTWMFSKMLVAKATKLAHVSTKGLIMYTTSIYRHIYECHVVKSSKGNIEQERLMEIEFHLVCIQEAL